MTDLPEGTFLQDVGGIKWSSRMVDLVKSGKYDGYPIFDNLKRVLEGTETYAEGVWPCGCLTEFELVFREDSFFMDPCSVHSVPL